MFRRIPAPQRTASPAPASADPSRAQVLSPGTASSGARRAARTDTRSGTRTDTRSGTRTDTRSGMRTGARASSRVDARTPLPPTAAVTGGTLAERAMDPSGLQSLTPVELRALAEAMFHSPDLTGRLSARHSAVSMVNLVPGGSARQDLTLIEALDRVPSALPDAPHARETRARVPRPAYLPTPLVPEGALVRGRTIHFRDPAGRRRALKLPKAHDALEYEFRMDGCFATWKSELGLSGDYPRALGFISFVPSEALIDEVTRQAAGDFQLAGARGEPMNALLYEPPEGYETYLHEVPDLTALEVASHKCLRDAGKLAGRLGLVCNAAADLYHNQSDPSHPRPWRWNVDRTGDAPTRTNPRLGAGRLEAWERAVRTINMGPTGPRDAKNYVFLEELPGFESNPRLVLSSYLGDYLNAWSLAVSKWLCDHELIEDQPRVARLMSLGFSTFFAAYTGRPEVESRKFVGRLADWRRVARQMAFFLGRGNIEHLERQASGLLPPEIYGPGVVARSYRPNDEDGWHPELGWTRDGRHRDLGPVNGPYPLTELVRALFATTASAIALRTEPESPRAQAPTVDSTH